MAFFPKLKLNYLCKFAWLPGPIFFWIPRALAKFCFFRIVLTEPLENIPVFVGTTDRKPEYLQMRRNACAVRKVGTVLKVLSEIPAER